MVDIATCLNELNLNLENQCKLLPEFLSNIKSFEVKHKLWHIEILTSEFFFDNIEPFYEGLPKKIEGLIRFVKKMIVSFERTYILEKEFSDMYFRKDKISSRLTDEHK